MKYKKTILILLILIFFSISQVSAEDNDTLLSSENTIYVNNSYTGNLEDGSINHPYKSLESGVNNLTEDIENIYIANGEYLIENPINFTNKTLTITGESTNVILTSTGNGNIFTMYDGTYTLDSLTITNGTGYNEYGPGFGGAIYTRTTDINSKLNKTHSEAVLIYNTLTIKNCVFRDNSASVGGAIYGAYSNILISSSRFENNTSGKGGAIRVGNTHLIVDDTIFANNIGGSGGAAYLDESISSFNNTVFESNFANTTGALYTTYGVLELNNTKIIDNFAGGEIAYGGAMTIVDTVTEIRNSIISNNTITVIGDGIAYGGAIVNVNKFATEILNTTISQNYANATVVLGSAIYNKGFLNLIDSIITDNSQNSGMYIKDAIYNSNGIVTNNNSIIENNTSNDNIDNNSYGIVLTISSPFVTGTINYDNITLPEKYDLRNVTLANGTTVSYVTPVKNQGNFKTCWAFTSIAALESHLLLTEGISYNFSEINLRNLMSNTSETGYDTDGNGGSFYYSTAYFSRWSGPVNETDDPYDINSTISSENLTKVKHVQDMIFIPLRTDFTDLNQIKAAILKYGGVGTMFDATDYEMIDVKNNQSTRNFYEPVPSDINHAVLLVGWDDNYSADNFDSRYGKPEGDGAFIIKNSWGNAKGDSGYYYISYYDATFGEGDSFAFAITNVEETNNYKDLYQYDPLSATTTFIGYNNETAWLKNVFISESDDPLAAFSIITSAPQTEYEANIYLNDELVATKNDTINEPGYHTIKLDQYVTLKKGDKFDIIVKLTTPGFYTPIAIQTKIDEISPQVTAEKGHSYISRDGETWTDIAGEMLTVYQSGEGILFNILNHSSVCIKAFTAYTNETELTCNEYTGISLNPKNLTGKLVDHEGNGIANQTIGITLTRLDTGLNKTYYVLTDNEGNYQLPINLAANKYTAEASFNGYNSLKYSNSEIANITIKKDNKTTTILETKTYNEKYPGDGKLNKNFTGTLKLEDGTVLAKQTIYITLTRTTTGASKTYTITTDENGNYYLPISLAIGQYQAVCSYTGTTEYSSDKTTTSLTITA